MNKKSFVSKIKVQECKKSLWLDYYWQKWLSEWMNKSV